jgi:hypothetical protein
VSVTVKGLLNLFLYEWSMLQCWAFVVELGAPMSEGSELVVDKDALRSTREMSKVMLTSVSCIVCYLAEA